MQAAAPGQLLGPATRSRDMRAALWLSIRPAGGLHGTPTEPRCLLK